MAASPSLAQSLVFLIYLFIFSALLGSAKAQVDPKIASAASVISRYKLRNFCSAYIVSPRSTLTLTPTVTTTRKFTRSVTVTRQAVVTSTRIQSSIVTSQTTVSVTTRQTRVQTLPGQTAEQVVVETETASTTRTLTETSTATITSSPTITVTETAFSTAFYTDTRSRNYKRAAVISTPKQLTVYKHTAISKACTSVLQPKTTTVTSIRPTKTITMPSTTFKTATIVSTSTFIVDLRIVNAYIQPTTRVITLRTTQTTSFPPVTRTIQSRTTQVEEILVTEIAQSSITLVLPTTSTSIVIVATNQAVRPIVDYKNLPFPDSRDKLPDFSFAGYHSSNDPLPSSERPPTLTLYPTNDQSDRSLELQLALDVCFGGVILLSPGSYTLSSPETIRFTTSCTLRGSPAGDTIIYMEATNRILFSMGPAVDGLIAYPETNTRILDPYVGVGSRTVQVQDPSGLYPGKTVFVQRRSSGKWLSIMGMDQLVRNGVNQTWIGKGRYLQQPRTITSIEGNTITFDVPLTDAVNGEYDDGRIVGYTAPVQLTEVGVEHIVFVRNPDVTGLPITVSDLALQIKPWTRDVWIRGIKTVGFNQMLMVNANASRITISDSTFERTLTPDATAGNAADIGIAGSQVLISGCTSINPNGSKAYEGIAQSLTPGPVVVLNQMTIGAGSSSPHQRWATGFLLDNSTVSSSQLENRGTAGSGQGWTIGAGFNWNTKATLGFTVQKPPISQNFCVGCIGKHKSSTGEIIWPGVRIQPESLFVAQLKDRLGAEQAANVLGLRSVQ